MIEIKQIPWSETADRGLSRALPNPIIRSIVAAEVTRGISLLWDCSGQGHHALVVSRLDLNPPELVIVAFEGTGMLLFGPHFVNAAKLRGIPLRAHVESPFVARLLRRLGLFPREIVLRSAA